MGKSNSSIQRVQLELNSLGIDTEIKELPASTRTALEAARAVGCQVGQIVKSLVFQGITSQKPLLILTSGANQVDETLLAETTGEIIKFASVHFVREETGFAIGGVSPFGLKEKITTYIDEDLLQYPLIWAAAGSPQAVFSIQPDSLVKATGGKVITVHSKEIE
jgi:prolyl-tRNA editing enzyme YbaK/EbsC (Cys-tRNA(Pro) deacylase)